MCSYTSTIHLYLEVYCAASNIFHLEATLKFYLHFSFLLESNWTECLNFFKSRNLIFLKREERNYFVINNIRRFSNCNKCIRSDTLNLSRWKISKKKNYKKRNQTQKNHKRIGSLPPLSIVVQTMQNLYYTRLKNCYCKRPNFFFDRQTGWEEVEGKCLKLSYNGSVKHWKLVASTCFNPRAVSSRPIW